MKRITMLAIVMAVAGCASPWPKGSYASLDRQEDARTVAYSVGQMVGTDLTQGSTVALATAPGDDNALTLALQDEIQAAGLSLGKDGHTVSYVAAPLNDGLFVRVSIDNSYGGSRAFTRDDKGKLVPAGPAMMVPKP